MFRLWFGPVRVERLDLFTRCFAVSALIYFAHRSSAALEWLTREGFHPSASAEYLHAPPPLPLLPVWAVPFFLAVFFSSLLGLLSGRHTKKLAAVATVCTIYVTYADITAAFTLNKFFIIGFAVIALQPPAVTLEDGRRVHSGWAVRVLQLSFVILMWNSGICKVLHGDWIVVGGLARHGFDFSLWFEDTNNVLWQHAHAFYRTGVAAWLLRHLPVSAWTVMQYNSLVYELAAPALFFVRRLRPLAIVWTLGFQLMIALTMADVYLFNIQVCCFLLLFLGDGLIDRWGRVSRPGNRGRMSECET